VGANSESEAPGMLAQPCAALPSEPLLPRTPQGRCTVPVVANVTHTWDFSTETPYLAL